MSVQYSQGKKRQRHARSQLTRGFVSAWRLASDALDDQSVPLPYQAYLLDAVSNLLACLLASLPTSLASATAP